MNDPKFKLFHDAALRSARVKWLLHELIGDDFELEYVDIYAGEQYSPRYLALNPNHCVPVLEITMPTGESIRMIESAAMVDFLGDAFPEKGLAPRPGVLSVQRADYLQMLHFCATMDMMLWQIRIHEHVLPERARDVRTIERYRNKFATEVEPQLRIRLTASRYICGDAFCAVDCIVAHVVMWARLYGLCTEAPFERYLATVAARPAYAKAFSDAHRFVPEVPRDAPVVEMFTG